MSDQFAGDDYDCSLTWAHTCREEALLAGASVLSQPPSILKFFIHLLQMDDIAAHHLQFIFVTLEVII
jgi:hypothetical protein